MEDKLKLGSSFSDQFGPLKIMAMLSFYVLLNVCAVECTCICTPGLGNMNIGGTGKRIFLNYCTKFPTI